MILRNGNREVKEYPNKGGTESTGTILGEMDRAIGYKGGPMDRSDPMFEKRPVLKELAARAKERHETELATGINPRAKKYERPRRRRKNGVPWSGEVG